MTLESVTRALREHPFLQGFAPEHIDKLAAMAGEARFRRGELLFREGDPPNLFYLLLSGKVALETSAPGRVLRIVTLGGGEQLGWSSINARHGRSFQARSLEVTHSLTFEGIRLRQACEEDRRFGYMLMCATLRVVAERLQSTRLQLLDVYSPLSAHAV
jgi:CRP-like cAMP-binding protein